MATHRFFGSLAIVVGVFVAFAGGCFALFAGLNGGGLIQSLIVLLVGIVLIGAGIAEIRKGRKADR